MSLRPGDDVRADFAGQVVATGPGWVLIRAAEGGVVWQVPVGPVLDVPVGGLVLMGQRDDGLEGSA